MLKQRAIHWYGLDPEQDALKPWQRRLCSFAAWIDRMNVVVAFVAALCCFALAVLTCALVLFGAFNLVHNGFEELKWHLCGAVFMLGGAYCFERNAHVRVDTFYAKFTPRWQAFVDIIGMVLCVWPFAVLLLVNGADIAFDAFSRSEASNDAGGLPYRWIIKSVIPLGFFLLWAQSLAIVCRAVAVFAVGGAGHTAESQHA